MDPISISKGAWLGLSACPAECRFVGFRFGSAEFVGVGDDDLSVCSGLSMVFKDGVAALEYKRSEVLDET